MSGAAVDKEGQEVCRGPAKGQELVTLLSDCWGGVWGSQAPRRGFHPGGQVRTFRSKCIMHLHTHTHSLGVHLRMPNTHTQPQPIHTH